MQSENGKSLQSSPQQEYAGRRSYVPLCDIYENSEAYVILADLPGSDEKEVDLKVEKNVLTISARGATVPRSGKARVSEYQEGDYKRTLQLSDRIDADKIDATMKNGVLRIILPKAVEHKPRKIEVRVS